MSERREDLFAGVPDAPVARRADLFGEAEPKVLDGFLERLEETSDTRLASALISGTDSTLTREVVDAAIELVARGQDRVDRTKRQMALFKARLDAAVRDAEERLAFVLRTLGEQPLREYVLKNANRGKQSLVTPSGTISIVASSGGPRKDDEDALREALILEGMTEFLEEQPQKVLWAPLKARLQSTGEDLAGVSFAPPSHQLRFSVASGSSSEGDES